MKQAMFGVIAGFIVILSIVAVLTVEGRNNRESELETALSASVEETLENLCVDQKYTVETQDEFVADFCQALLGRIQAGTEEAGDENLSVRVDVVEADLEKGLLSVVVTETFTHPNGSLGTVSCSSTALLEREAPRDEVVLTYYVGDQIYQQYGLLEGEDFRVPAAPSLPGRTFSHWAEEDTGQRADFPGKATENRTYRAVFL